QEPQPQGYATVILIRRFPQSIGYAVRRENTIHLGTRCTENAWALCKESQPPAKDEAQGPGPSGFINTSGDPDSLHPAQPQHHGCSATTPAPRPRHPDPSSLHLRSLICYVKQLFLNLKDKAGITCSHVSHKARFHN
uniref:Uncharacterized protein n=1 Tax=Corvus moneduloides TaxID=1196302 RepID=A0A8U7N395_CORMO